jgi:DNA-binding MarR family transcriptional regulator
MEGGSTRTGARRRRSRTSEPIVEAQSLCSYWLKRAEKCVSGSLAQELKARGIIASEWAAIRELSSGPIRLSPVEVARAIGMTKGGASKLVDRLVKKGLAKKTVGEFDRRFRAVELTERGEELVTHFAMLEGNADREMFGNLARRRRLLQALKRVVLARRREPVDIWQVVWPMASSRRARANARGWVDS